MPKVLITGAHSFVGSSFLKFTQFKNTVEVSLREYNPEDIDFNKSDVVLHLAAIVHQSKEIPEDEYLKINRDLCLHVAEHAKRAGVKQFIFLSTCKVYGDFISDLDLRDEDSKCYPNDSYGKSKYEAEIGLRKLEDSKFTVSIIRTPLVYGEGVKANMLSIIRLVDSVPILPFKAINNKRNYTYSENLVGFIDRIIEKRASGIFIASDNDPISTTDLVRYLSVYLGRKVVLFKLPKVFFNIGMAILPRIFDRLFNSQEFDNTKTKAKLEYEPPFSTEEGIKRMINSFKNEKKTR
jgi:nucleoside-diphosphate-sugar epimerase